MAQTGFGPIQDKCAEVFPRPELPQIFFFAGASFVMLLLAYGGEGFFLLTTFWNKPAKEEIRNKSRFFRSFCLFFAACGGLSTTGYTIWYFLPK